MRMPSAQIERIRDLGYTEAQAQFLYIVAVHSGYFTLGQFLAFTKARYGKRPTSFAQRLIKQGHATARDYLRKGSIFHLFSRTVYGQIDKDNLRNRKRHSFEFMRTRLVLLDFILAHQDLEYFESEQEKVSFFCETLRISRDRLPAKVYEGSPGCQPTIRYFVDKFPLFLAPPVSFSPCVVTLSYVDSGQETPSHYLAHLGAYQALFHELRNFRFLYIGANSGHFRKAEQTFWRLVGRRVESDVAGEILKYFQIRKKWDDRGYLFPVTADFEFLTEARRRFAGDRFDAVYRSWRAGEVTEEGLRDKFSDLRPDRAVSFESCLVRQHGVPLADVCRRGDGRANKARHPLRHRSRHLLGDVKLLEA